MYKWQANISGNYQNQPVLLSFTAYFYGVCAYVGYDFTVWVHFLLVKLFPVHGREHMFGALWSSPKNSMTSGLGNGMRIDIVAKRRWGPQKGWGAPNSGLHLTHPLPHTRLSGPGDLRSFRSVPFLPLLLLTTLSCRDFCSCFYHHHCAPLVFSPQHTRGIFQKYQSGYIVPCIKSFFKFNF